MPPPSRFLRPSATAVAFLAPLRLSRHFCPCCPRPLLLCCRRSLVSSAPPPSFFFSPCFPLPLLLCCRRRLVSFAPPSPPSRLLRPCASAAVFAPAPLGRCCSVAAAVSFPPPLRHRPVAFVAPLRLSRRFCPCSPRPLLGFSTRNQSRKSDIFKVPFFSMTLGPDFFRRQKTFFCNNFVRFSFL